MYEIDWDKVPAWLQAAGSVFALVVAIVLSRRQHKSGLDLLVKQKEIERRAKKLEFNYAKSVLLDELRPLTDLVAHLENYLRVSLESGSEVLAGEIAKTHVLSSNVYEQLQCIATSFEIDLQFQMLHRDGLRAAGYIKDSAGSIHRSQTLSRETSEHFQALFNSYLARVQMLNAAVYRDWTRFAVR